MNGPFIRYKNFGSILSRFVTMRLTTDQQTNRQTNRFR